MPDREWYTVPGLGDFPNQEAAFETAERAACKADGEVEVSRVTSTVIRRYRRTVSVTTEDVPPAP